MAGRQVQGRCPPQTDFGQLSVKPEKDSWFLGDRSGSAGASAAGAVGRVHVSPPSLPDVLQRVTLVDDNPACGARVVLFQVLHQAAPADCGKAHSHQKASAQSRRRPQPMPRPAGTAPWGVAASTTCQVPTGQASHCSACCLTRQAGGLGTRGMRKCVRTGRPWPRVTSALTTGANTNILLS